MQILYADTFKDSLNVDESLTGQDSSTLVSTIGLLDSAKF